MLYFFIICFKEQLRHVFHGEYRKNMLKKMLQLLLL